MKNNILVLGHNGLLGNMVYLYFKVSGYNVITTDLRWPNENFKQFVSDQKVDYIINCIGIIPQKRPDEYLYNLVNYELPLWLDNLGVKIIHPDTDEGDDTPYGLAKRMAREGVYKNTKILKTSILGYEKNSSFSFFNWFLSSEKSVNGFTNQFWNGNTTLEWAKWCESIMKNWENFKKLTVISNPECLSKYEILNMIKDIFKKEIEIVPVESNLPKNNCMEGDFNTNKLTNQIIEMKYFYNKNMNQL
jgi:dTDP-4-dehydrorhamnose reductase